MPSDKSLLAFSIRIFDGDRQGVTERLLGIGKADFVPSQV